MARTEGAKDKVKRKSRYSGGKVREKSNSLKEKGWVERSKINSRWSHTTEPTLLGTRHGVYNQDTGDMKSMGLGKEGSKRAQGFRRKHQ